MGRSENHSRARSDPDIMGKRLLRSVAILARRGYNMERNITMQQRSGKKSFSAPQPQIKQQRVIVLSQVSAPKTKLHFSHYPV